MRIHAGWLLTVLLLAASLAAFPQTSARITLNVVAFDSHDQVVSDLTSQDFQVSDQGKPQRIVSFHREPEATPNNVPPVVILFDLLNDNLSNRGYGTEEIIHALEHSDLSDSLYLYLLTSEGQLSPVRRLPSPQEDNPPDKTPWTQHIKPLLEAAIDNTYGLRAGNSAGAFDAIEALGAALRPFPGRKNLIWMTHGVPFTPYQNLVRDLATKLDREGITVNSVDLGRSLSVESGAINTLDEFAKLTGGKVSTDVPGTVKEVMASSRSGYVIQYAAPRPDGKFHKIRVTCSRKGVRLQVKQGYYAN